MFGKKAGLVINLKFVLFLLVLGLIEDLVFIYPLLRQAPDRYASACRSGNSEPTKAKYMF